MGSGRGDRNQPLASLVSSIRSQSLQWGPVVVTGISNQLDRLERTCDGEASMGSGRGDRNQSRLSLTRVPGLRLQWGPVVVTGIRARG